MSAPSPTPTRLARLDQILSQSPPPVASRAAETDPGQVHLTSVPLERIRALTVELQLRDADDLDELDAITMRLLLNDYKTAVAHLRAVANGAGTQLQAASAAVNDVRKARRREEEMQAKRAARESEDGD